jgi:DNA-binding CsgD family transcriptional regulator
LFSIALPETAHLSEPVEPTPPAPRRDRSAAARSAARQERAEREATIVSLLNRGFSVAEIADRNGVSERAMRKSIRTLLARRAPAPPAEFLALQVSRLNEALLVAYGAMSAENLEAVDRVVKIVRELDRYHGFAVQAAPPRPPRLPPPSAAPLALEAFDSRAEPIGAATD